MDLTIHASFLPHEDPVASLAFSRDALGFEVRDDVGSAPGWAGEPSLPVPRPSSERDRDPITDDLEAGRTILRQPVRRTRIRRSSRVGGRRTVRSEHEANAKDEANAKEEANAEEMTTTHDRHQPD